MVTFDSVGAGNRLVSTGTSVSSSWTHTISTSDNGTFVAVFADVDWRGSDTVGVTVSVTYGGQAMTARGGGTTATAFSFSGATNFQNHYFAFHLVNPPTGAQTVTVTAVASSNVYCITGNSVAYQGADSFTTVPIVGGNGTTTLSSPAGAMKICYADSTSAITTSGWTSRYANGGTVNSATTYFAVGDLAGTGSASGTLSPYPSGTTGASIYELYPPTTGNIRPNCRTASGVNTTATGTVTFTHTADVGNNIAAVLLVAHYGSISGTVASPATVTYGGQSMTLLGNGGTQPGYNRMSLYGILGISPGAATVSVGSLTQGTKGLFLMTYDNVGSFGTASGNTGTISVTGSENGAIVWGGTSTNGTLSSSAADHYSRAGGPLGEVVVPSQFAGGILFDTVLASESVTSFSGVGVPLNQAPNHWFSS